MTLDEHSSPDSPGDDRRAIDELFSLVYEQLRRLAATVRRSDRRATINPTALVNDAWLKLAGSPALASLPRDHFMRLAARAMRQVLVEAARRRLAHKRGAGLALVTFDESVHGAATGAEELLAIDAALDELAVLSARQAAMIEYRFFGGLDVAETAKLLGVAEITVHRDWRVARAWLARRLRPGD